MIANNTVRIIGHFKTYNGNYSDPTDITFKVFDKFGQQVGDTISVTEDYKIETGRYYVDYLIPREYFVLYYEMSGTLEGSIITGRGKLTITNT